MPCFDDPKYVAVHQRSMALGSTLGQSNLASPLCRLPQTVKAPCRFCGKLFVVQDSRDFIATGKEQRLMAHAEGHITINCPSATVYAFLLDGMNNPRWRPTVV